MIKDCPICKDRYRVNNLRQVTFIEYMKGCLHTPEAMTQSGMVSVPIGLLLDVALHLGVQLNSQIDAMSAELAIRAAFKAENVPVKQGVDITKWCAADCEKLRCSENGCARGM